MKKRAMLITATALILLSIPLQSFLLTTSSQQSAINSVKKPHVYGVRQDTTIGPEMVASAQSQVGSKSIVQKETEESDSSNIVFNLDPSLLEQNEESLAVNPTDSRVVLGGTNDYRNAFTAGVIATGFEVTSDGGMTISADGVLSPTDPFNTALTFSGAGDPSAAFDGNGNAFMGSVGFFFGGTAPAANAPDNGIFVFSSPPPYNTWTQHTVIADNNPSIIDDKDWVAADQRTSGTGAGGIYAVWARFGEGTSPFGGPGSPIRFAASFDHGNTWILLPVPVSATNLCQITGPNPADRCPDNQFSYVVVGASGTVYVSWVNFDTPDQSELVFETSVTVTCTTSPACLQVGPVHEVATIANPVFETFDFTANRIGGLADQRQRVDTIPKMAVDASTGKTSGRLYIAWEDLNQGSYFNMGPVGFFSFLGSGCSSFPVIFNCLGRGSEVVLTHSDDQGATWSTPTRVDTLTNSQHDSQHDSQNDAFNVALSVDPATGKVQVTWYDTQSDPGNVNLAVMLRQGTPTTSGVKWKGSERNVLDGFGAKSIDLSSDIQRQTRGNFAGDYISVASLNGRVYIGWTDTRPMKNGFHQEDNMLASVGEGGEGD